MLVEIENTTVRTRTFQTKKNKEMTLIEQDVWFHIDGNPYPIKGRINVPADVRSYAVGLYTMTDKNFYTDNFGGLKLSMETILVPHQGSK